MRARLTVAILAVVAGTLVVTALGGVVLIRRSAATTAEQQLYAEARVVAELAARQAHPGAHGSGVLADTGLLRLVGDYRALSVVPVDAQGDVTGTLPAAVAGSLTRPAALSRGEAVAGTAGSVVWVLIPLQLTAAQKASLQPPVPPGRTAVLVATRTVGTPVTGLGYFLLVSLLALAVAAGVALWLADRFSRPVRDAVSVTGRIAGGDLATRMATPPDEVPEFAELASSINAMADTLAAAAQQQRQFLLSVSHDLRTPLTSIAGYAEAIADGTTPEPAAAAGVIRTEAARLDRLVGDLLDLARLDARRYTFALQPLDPADVVADAARRFGPEAAGAGLALRTDLPAAGAPAVLADPDRLAQVLSNLLENAARYAARHVVVGARGERGGVVLWVADDGPGIAPDDLERVFEPHFSADTRRRGRPGPGRSPGTGLGLAIVAELAAAMGGRARAESPVDGGRGTRISVWLPAAPPATAPAPPR